MKSPRPLFLSILTLVGSVLANDAARVTFLVGSAEIRREGKSLPVKAQMNCRVGDTLRLAASSRLELRYPDATLVRLDENSVLVLTNRSKGKPEPVLITGNVWANVKKIGQGGTGFGVRTPTAVAAVRGTVFNVEGGADSSQVRLYEGKVDVGTAKMDSLRRARGETTGPKEVSLDKWVRLLRGEQVVCRKDGSWTTGKFDAKTDAQDPWVKWNAELDSKAGRPLVSADSLAAPVPESERTKDPDDPWAN